MQGWFICVDLQIALLVVYFRMETSRKRCPTWILCSRPSHLTPSMSQIYLVNIVFFIFSISSYLYCITAAWFLDWHYVRLGMYFWYWSLIDVAVCIATGKVLGVLNYMRVWVEGGGVLKSIQYRVWNIDALQGILGDSCFLSLWLPWGITPLLCKMCTP